MNDIYTMRTELANDFAVAGAKLLSFTATAGALAAIPETEPQQYVVAGTLESIQKVLPADEPSHPQRRLRRGDRPAEPLSFDEAAPAAPDGLNAERIVEIYRDTFNNMPGAAREAPRNVPPLVVEFGRAIAKECVASVAPAEPVIPAPSVKPWHERTSQYETPEFSQIERMEAEIAELRHLANYRLQRVNALADQIQAYSAHIARQAQPTDRDAALEQAAQIVMDAPLSEEYGESPYLNDDCKAMALTTANKIRALKGKSGSGKPADGAAIEEMRKIGSLVATQDNRITDQPMFIVQQRRRVYGFDTGYCENVIWLCSEDEYNEASEEESAQLEAEYQETGRVKNGWSRTGYTDQWEFVTACFTEQGCKDYLARDGHNLKEPRIYAEGSYRNEEYRAVRKYLMSLSGSEGAAS